MAPPQAMPLVMSGCFVRLTQAAMVCLLLSGTSFASDSAKSERALIDSLLRHTIGGERALQALKEHPRSRQSGSGKTNGQAITFFTCTARPNRFELRLSIDSISMGMGYDGLRAWSQDVNESVRLLDGPDRRQIVTQAFLLNYGYLFPAELGCKRRYDGVITRDGSRVHQLQIYVLEGDSVYLFIDSVSGRLVGDRTWQDQYTVESVYSDHRLVDSVLVVGQIESTTHGTHLRTSLIFEQIDMRDGCAVGSERNVGDLPRHLPDDFVFPDNTSAVVVPFVISNGHIWFQGEIRGAKRSFILDSGASANVYDSAGVAAFSYPVAGEVQGQGVSGFSTASLIQIDTLKIGSVILFDQVAGCLNLDALAGSNPYPVPFGGIIGYDFLSRFIVEIDYAGEQCVVRQFGEYNPPAGSHKLPLQFTMNVPSVKANLAGIEGQFLIDIGNAFGIILHAPFYDRNSLDTLLFPTGLKRQIGGVGGASPSRAMIARNFSLGSIQFDSVVVLQAETEIGIAGSRNLAGNLGYEILSRFRLVFDYHNHVLYLAPAAN